MNASPEDHSAPPSPGGPRIGRKQVLAFMAVATVSVAGVMLYAGHLQSRQRIQAADAAQIVTAVVTTLPSAARSPDGVARPYVLFRHTGLGNAYGHVALGHLDDLRGTRLVAGLECERVHMASGVGVCLEAQRGAITSYRAHVFDEHFQIRSTHPLAGPPSRARVSPDGRLAAFTVFVTGHSYASTGFVTRTTIVDAATGHTVVEDLESFAVIRDDRSIKAPDFNFWGVTFSRNARKFYATLGTGGKTLLVEGDIDARRMQVLREGVECPSLSPDNRHIVFKRRRQARGSEPPSWGIGLIDLATGEERLLAVESRNVDDQIEWLSDDALLYAMPRDDGVGTASTDLWTLPIRGDEAPRLFLPLAYSPAVVR